MTQLFTDDSELLHALKSESRLFVNSALKQLYQSTKLFDNIRNVIRGMGGTEDDAKEMMREALIVFFEHVEVDKYNPAISSIATYIVAIAKKKYFTYRRSEQRRSARYDRAIDLGAVETMIDPEMEWNLEYRKTLLNKLLATTGERCQQLLKLRSFDYSMTEIATMMHYKSPAVAKAAARDCREKLNKYLAENPGLLAELKEL